jgi:hypothetical protein
MGSPRCQSSIDRNHLYRPRTRRTSSSNSLEKGCRIHCPNCACIMQSHGSQTIEEEHGVLVITSWWCEPCNQPYEEILANQANQGMQRQRLLYPVRSIESTVPQAMRRLGRTGRIQAHALGG